MTSERVAAELRAELARQRKTVRELARIVGWSVTTTARKVSGEQSLVIEDIATLAGALNVSALRLLEIAATDEPPLAQEAVSA